MKGIPFSKNLGKKKCKLVWWIKGGGQSRVAAVPGWTINLCLFQLPLGPKLCKIQAGMSSISVSSSVPFCAGRWAAVMDWFCHLCSVHSMLTWRGRARLWMRALLGAPPWPDIPFSVACSACLISVTLTSNQYTHPPFIPADPLPHLHSPYIHTCT